MLPIGGLQKYLEISQTFEFHVNTTRFVFFPTNPFDKISALLTLKKDLLLRKTYYCLEYLELRANTHRNVE